MRKRLRFWRQAVGLWWSILMAFYAAIALFGIARAELLSPADQDRWRILNVIPNWPWSSWLVGFLLLTIAAMLEGFYRAHRKGMTEKAIETDVLRTQLSSSATEVKDWRDKWHALYAGHLDLQQEMSFAETAREVLENEVARLQGQLDDRATRKEDRQALTLFSQAGIDLYDRINSRPPGDSLTEVRKWTNDVEAYLLERSDRDESSVLLFRGPNPDIPRLDTSPHNGDERSQEALQRFMKNRLARLRRFISETRY